MVTLLFSTQRWAPLAALIRWGTRSEWSHVDVILPSKIEVVGARGMGGVKVRLLADEMARASRVAFANVEGVDEEAFYTFLDEQVGKPYDWAGIWGFPTNRNWQADDKWFCSELVAAALAHGGVTVAHEHAGRITPRDLWVSPVLTQRRVN